MAEGGISPPDSPPDSPSPPRRARSPSPPPGWTGPRRLDSLDHFFASEQATGQQKGKVSDFKDMARPRCAREMEARQAEGEREEQWQHHSQKYILRRLGWRAEQIDRICALALREEADAIASFASEIRSHLSTIQIIKMHRPDLPDWINLVYHDMLKELERLRPSQLAYHDPEDIKNCFRMIRMKIQRILDYTRENLPQSPQPQQRSGPPRPRRLISHTPQRPQSPSTQPMSPRSRPQSPQLRPQSPQLRPQSPQLRPRSTDVRRPSPQLRLSPQLRPRSLDQRLQDPRDEDIVAREENQQLLSKLQYYDTLSASQKSDVDRQMATLPEHIQDYMYYLVTCDKLERYQHYPQQRQQWQSLLQRQVQERQERQQQQQRQPQPRFQQQELSQIIQNFNNLSIQQQTEVYHNIQLLPRHQQNQLLNEIQQQQQEQQQQQQYRRFS